MVKDTKFGKLLERLEQIVEKLENEDLDLDEATKLIEEGLKIHKICKIKLSKNQDLIKKVLKEGEVN